MSVPGCQARSTVRLMVQNNFEVVFGKPTKTNRHHPQALLQLGALKGSGGERWGAVGSSKSKAEKAVFVAKKTLGLRLRWRYIYIAISRQPRSSTSPSFCVATFVLLRRQGCVGCVLSSR